MKEEFLHVAICQAVERLNQGDVPSAHNILREALDDRADTRINNTPMEAPDLDFEQRQQAVVIAESRGIDLETAYELVYLRDRADTRTEKNSTTENPAEIITK